MIISSVEDGKGSKSRIWAGTYHSKYNYVEGISLQCVCNLSEGTQDSQTVSTDRALNRCMVTPNPLLALETSRRMVSAISYFHVPFTEVGSYTYKSELIPKHLVYLHWLKTCQWEKDRKQHSRTNLRACRLLPPTPGLNLSHHGISITVFSNTSEPCSYSLFSWPQELPLPFYHFWIKYLCDQKFFLFLTRACLSKSTDIIRSTSTDKI